MRLKTQKKKLRKFQLNNYTCNVLNNKFSIFIFVGNTSTLLFIAVVFLFSIGCNQANQMAEEGILQLEQGKSVTALTLFEEALEIDSENSIALYGKGQILIQQEVTRHMGKSMLKKAVLRLSDRKQQKSAAFLLAQFSETKDGIEILYNMIKRKFNDPDVYLQLAAYQTKLKEKKKALATYLEAIDLYPQQARLKVKLAYFYAANMRNYRKAFEYYKQASDTQEDDIDCLIGFAKTSYLIGKTSESMTIIQKILGQKITKQKANELEIIKKEIKQHRWRPTF